MGTREIRAAERWCRGGVVRGLALLLGLAAGGVRAQQPVACGAGATTTISGTVYAPNGTDPLPNVLVYIPTTAVGPLQDGISCPLPGQPPPGNPQVGAVTAVDGTFTLTDAPAGTDVPIVIQAGKWRRQLVVATVPACSTTTFNARFARNQGEGDIPKFAVSTGEVDQVECVLRKIGVDDAEFTNPGGTGRVQLFRSDLGPGATINPQTPRADALLGDATTLNGYDVLMLPCEGEPNVESAAQLANLRQYADGGGRVYASHYSYVWFWHNAPYDTVARWTGSTGSLSSGVATVDQSTAAGVELAQWLQVVGASTTPGQIAVQEIRFDVAGVNAPTEASLRLNITGSPVMQFTFPTPVQAKNQCGRVLFDEYHVENGDSAGKTFPTECRTGPMTAQEKLLEYSLFDLANNGQPATIAPSAVDFGQVAAGTQSGAQQFTVTNNSLFGSGAAATTVTGPFAVTGTTCGQVVAGGTCTVTVVAQPTALGAATGGLTVVFGGTTVKSTLTVTGTPAVTAGSASVNFGSTDVGATLGATVVLQNHTAMALPLPAFAVTGDFAAGNDCSGMIPASGTCNLQLQFKPTAYGPRVGTVAGSGAAEAIALPLSGTGLDFSVALMPASSSAEAGTVTTAQMVLTPLGGAHAPVHVSCSADGPGMSCGFDSGTADASGKNLVPFHIVTTSKTALVGYGGLGGGRGTLAGLLAIAGVLTGGAVLRRRRQVSVAGLVLLVLSVVALPLGLGGCSGKQPPQNQNWTTPGTYTVTVVASDGVLTRSAVYSLSVYK